MAAQDLFSHLPSEITIAIFSRLSARAVAVSKCVCKAWLDLLVSDYFVDSHHSKSAAALAVLVRGQFKTDRDWCKVFEIEDGVDDLQSNNPITKSDPPYMTSPIVGSANGLLILNCYCERDYYYVCNPITRECIEICSPKGDFTAAYGFGVSKVSGEHKVVRIVRKSDYCDVYTLGTERWRRVEAATAAIIDVSPSSWLGAFVDGNIYWNSDPVREALIVCFDVETERFSTFPPPPVRGSRSYVEYPLFTLRDCLCYLERGDEDGIGVWLMKECGVEKSWRKEYVIKRHPDFGFTFFRPIKVFRNGDILVLCDAKMLCCYSVKAKTYQEIQSFGAIREKYSFINSFLFTPTFRSLKRNFGTEYVFSL